MLGVCLAELVGAIGLYGGLMSVLGGLVSVAGAVTSGFFLICGEVINASSAFF